MMTKHSTRDILNALGYTPKTLAADTGMSVYRAKKVLSGDGATFREFKAIMAATGIEANILGGSFKPGTARAATA